MRLHLLGGFLGAGKTTAVRALAQLLAARGERVAIITNDQGHALVDTALCEPVGAVTEIGGGCFCCQYGALEDALDAAAASGATVALAEAVGSCTDLVATVLSPLAERRAGLLSLAPLSVLVDPWRALEIAAGAFPADIAYLFRKQIEEADVVVLTRSDLGPPDVEPLIREIRSDVPVVRISATAGDGVAAWLARLPTKLAAPLDLDYDRYAAAEALLGWANGVARLTSRAPFSPREAIARFFAALADEPVAHLKVRVRAPADGGGHLVRRGDAPALDLAALPEQTAALELIVNARVALAPEVLERRLRAAMTSAAPGADVAWTDLQCFEPGRPVPVHRYRDRCDPSGEGSCCAAFYDRPDVQYLLGDSYHPGGSRLTLELAAALQLDERARLLDVACGKGTSLRAVLGAHPGRAVGMDLAASPGALDARLELINGDAHQIPQADGSFDAVLCECALSTFGDQPRALGEMLRVLKPGGRLALSDMVSNGPVPASLADWVHLGTCLSHARSLADYRGLVEAAGFEVLEARDATWALQALAQQIKRRLVGVALAKASGQLATDVAFDLKRGRDVLRDAEAVIADGTIGYGVLVARKPA